MNDDECLLMLYLGDYFAKKGFSRISNLIGEIEQVRAYRARNSPHDYNGTLIDLWWSSYCALYRSQRAKSYAKRASIIGDNEIANILMHIKIAEAHLNLPQCDIRYLSKQQCTEIFNYLVESTRGVARQEWLKIQESHLGMTMTPSSFLGTEINMKTDKRISPTSFPTTQPFVSELATTAAASGLKEKKKQATETENLSFPLDEFIVSEKWISNEDLTSEALQKEKSSTSESTNEAQTKGDVNSDILEDEKTQEIIFNESTEQTKNNYLSESFTGVKLSLIEPEVVINFTVKCIVPLSSEAFVCLNEFGNLYFITNSLSKLINTGKSRFEKLFVCTGGFVSCSTNFVISIWKFEADSLSIKRMSTFSTSFKSFLVFARLFHNTLLVTCDYDGNVVFFENGILKEGITLNERIVDVCCSNENEFFVQTVSKLVRVNLTTKQIHLITVFSFEKLFSFGKNLLALKNNFWYLCQKERPIVVKGSEGLPWLVGSEKSNVIYAADSHSIYKVQLSLPLEVQLNSIAEWEMKKLAESAVPHTIFDVFLLEGKRICACTKDAGRTKLFVYC